LIKYRPKLFGFCLFFLFFFFLIFNPVFLPHSHSFSFIHEDIKNEHTYTEHLNGDFSLKADSTPNLTLILPSVIIGIGTSWNVTFFLDSNSSSPVNGFFSYLYSSNNPEYWEGQRQFTILPGSSVNKLYVSHYCGDQMIKPEILLNLSMPDGNASGKFDSYIASLGFFPNIGTVYTYVSNITDWSLNYYNTSDSFQFSFLFPFPLVLLIYGLKRTFFQRSRGREN
jgi:hypothetical protein